VTKPAASPSAVGLAWVIAALVGGCVALAWAPGSMVRATPGAEISGELHWSRLYVIALWAAFGAYVLALMRARREPPRVRTVLLLAGLIQLLPLAAPLMLSTDVWSYWGYGRIAAVHGSDPYVMPPDAFPDDPATPLIYSGWRDQTSLYGPLFTLLSEVIALPGGTDPTLAEWTYKLLAASGVVGVALLASRLAPRPAFAAAFVGWNPVFAVQFGGAGHNDALMALLIMVAVALAARGRAAGAGVAWAAAVAWKWIPVVLVPLQVLEDRARAHRSIVPGLLAGAAALAGVATLRYGIDWATGSIPLGATTNLSLSPWPRLGAALPPGLVPAASLVAFAIAYLFLLRWAWRGRARRGLAMGLFFALSPYLWAWYALSPAALSAVDDDVPAMWLALGLCAIGLLYVDSVGWVIRVFG
jgi:hypothetical protein